MLGKNPNSVQNAITFVQKKDAELCSIEGFHNHASGHKLNITYNKQNDNQNDKGLALHGHGLHLIKYCNESICRPNLDNHTPAIGQTITFKT